MNRSHIENVKCEITIVAPSDLTAKEIHEHLSISKWTYEMDLMFEITGKVKKIDKPVLLQKKEGSTAWGIPIFFEIKLTPFEPIPDGYFDRDLTIEHLSATLEAPNGFYQILQSPFSVTE